MNKIDWERCKNNITKLLCPAGDGLYAVTSKSSIKNSLQQQIYNITGEQVIDKWNKFLTKPPVGCCLLGIPSDCGGGILRGANWGPLYLRKELYNTPSKIYDLGDIKVIPQLLLDEYLHPEVIKKCRQSLYDDTDINYPVSPLSIVDEVTRILYKYDQSLKILSLGGDHSVSYPLVKNYLKSKINKNAAVIHFDAHTDLLESRLGLPITFGSWVYHVLPYLSPGNFVQIGIRASKYQKSYWEDKYGIKQFWAEEILATPDIIQTILNYLIDRKVRELYISFDIDAIDEKFVQATGTPEPKGLNPDFVYKLLQELINNHDLGGADLVEVAPFIKSDKNDITMKISNKILNILHNGMS
ncbi:MAG: arginase family protein [Legionellales bacterium]|nr:arginase family protein [Legionellales bacterium]